MRADIHLYASTDMPDAGASGPSPQDRRYSNDEVVAAYRKVEAWAKHADELGYDTLWLTEHHFQYEGYEVVPNQVAMGLHLAGMTSRLRFGQAFNVVPTWHPLRLAEDFAMADVLTGGRMVFGVGRGTVPRESMPLGSAVASGDNAMSKEADERNREAFEEAMEIIRLAWAQERFSFHGKHYDLPPAGIPDRGRDVEELTLVPRPQRDVEIFQPVGSPRTTSYVAQQGFHGVFALASPSRMKRSWDHFAAEAEKVGRVLAPGQDRAMQLMFHIGDTTEHAMQRGRAGHDEYVKFLSPYGRFGQYGGDLPFDYAPTLEETMASKAMAFGSVDDVVDVLGDFKETLDLRHVLLFPELPGLTQDEVAEQMSLMAHEVLPRLGVELPEATPAR
jgi:alkanesulfonate monooxygenase SsuD/methylene tetrahydromethanopterin reductase-like flavin-dependent oxidoreductase (luciferase family)